MKIKRREIRVIVGNAFIGGHGRFKDVFKYSFSTLLGSTLSGFFGRFLWGRILVLLLYFVLVLLFFEAV